MNRISVIIPNFNYADFVAEAIDSALALQWPDVEVIVVDDGSTDGSRDVIAGYADIVTVLLQENSSQRVACNNGFAASTGDIVIFLDSDDLLEPALPQELAKVWRPGISKVQYQMERIDRDGRRLGTMVPALDRTPTPQQIRYWASTTTAYPTPPGTGNAYAGWFLQRIFPLDDSTGAFSDSACLAAAPFLGDVVTIRKPLARYRSHGESDSRLLTDPTRFQREVERARARHLFSVRIRGEDPGTAAERQLRRSRELLQFRVAAARVSPGGSGLPGDTRRRMAGDAMLSPFRPGPERIRRRVLIAIWCLVTLLAPSSLARRTIRLRYDR